MNQPVSTPRTWPRSATPDYPGERLIAAVPALAAERARNRAESLAAAEKLLAGIDAEAQLDGVYILRTGVGTDTGNTHPRGISGEHRQRGRLVVCSQTRRVFCGVTDMGWIEGPLSVFGTHANGATLLLYEGSPDRPDSNRLWRLAERHSTTMLGVSPTLVRSLRSAEPGLSPTPDLPSVHVLGSTGEPGDPESCNEASPRRLRRTRLG